MQSTARFSDLRCRSFASQPAVPRQNHRLRREPAVLRIDADRGNGDAAMPDPGLR